MPITVEVFTTAPHTIPTTIPQLTEEVILPNYTPRSANVAFITKDTALHITPTITPQLTEKIIYLSYNTPSNDKIESIAAKEPVAVQINENPELKPTGLTTTDKIVINVGLIVLATGTGFFFLGPTVGLIYFIGSTTVCVAGGIYDYMSADASIAAAAQEIQSLNPPKPVIPGADEALKNKDLAALHKAIYKKNLEH